MRCLAVIVACEGSELLPNKNIRLINGKPMIYYVINNAKQSKYITDIIVTTNSNEIISIAKQMNVVSYLRNKSLCNFNVSVDDVVLDVFNELNVDEYDYVVTMQSISPALKVQSLDNAFERMFATNADTIISVVNCQHFYWQIKENAISPIYSQRINCHQLPPFYRETGGFLISAIKNIKQGIRVGDKVELYELDSEESIDIYTFGDLKQVENIMSRTKTAFYVNGNSEIGYGHISRVLQIADELFSKPDIYFDVNQTKIEMFGDTSHNIIPINGKEEFFEYVYKNKYDTIINDILSTDLLYMKQLRSIVCDSQIINFEDDGVGSIYADIVINALYENESTEKYKNGHKYYVLPKSFLIYNPIKIKKYIKNIVVTFGGADPMGYTDRVLDIVTSGKYENINFHVILGVAKKNVEELKRYSKYENILIYHNIDYVVEIMNKSDLAITSRGRTCYELASLGIPTISIPQNDRELKHKYICSDNGFCCLDIDASTDDIENIIDEFLKMSYEEKVKIQNRLLKNDLRNGRSRLIELIRMK